METVMSNEAVAVPSPGSGNGLILRKYQKSNSSNLRN